MSDDRDNTGRRPRVHMGDDDRALYGHRARTRTPAPIDESDTPPDGAAPAPEVHDEITDVRELQRRAESGLAAVNLSPEMRQGIAVAVGILAQHQKHGEQRAVNRDSAVLAARGGDNVGERLVAVEDELHQVHSELDDIRGLRPARANGKIGNLRKDVAEVQGAHRSLRNGLITLLVVVLGGVGGAAKVIDDAADRRGSERARFEHVQTAVDALIEKQDAIRADLLILKLKLGLPLATPATGVLP